MRRKCLLIMVVLGFVLWAGVLCAGAQETADRCSPAVFNPQEKLSDHQLALAIGHGYEKPKPCQDGKIILWDEWRAKPASMINAGNQGQVIICGPQR
jgi:hypothetical protein